MSHAHQTTRKSAAPVLNTLTAAARVWVICDTLGRNATRQNVLAAAERVGVHQRTALNHYNLWRYAHKQERLAKGLPLSTRKQIAKVAAA